MFQTLFALHSQLNVENAGLFMVVDFIAIRSYPDLTPDHGIVAVVVCTAGVNCTITQCFTGKILSLEVETAAVNVSNTDQQWTDHTRWTIIQFTSNGKFLMHLEGGLCHLFTADRNARHRLT